MKVVDANNYNTFHTYRIPKSYRDWLSYNEWPDSDSDEQSADSMSLTDGQSDLDGDDDDDEQNGCSCCDSDSEKDGEEESDEYSSEYPETTRMDVEPDTEYVHDHEINEHHIDELRSQALMALDTKMLLSLGPIQAKIANLTGHDLVCFFSKAAGLWGNVQSHQEKSYMMKYMGLAFCLCVALENQESAPYATVLRESCWWGRESSVVTTMRCILPADNKYTMARRMSTFQIRDDEIAVSWAWRLRQMVAYPHRIIKAMYSLQQANEPKLKELLIRRLEKMSTEEIRSLLFPWILELSREDSGHLGQEALDLYVGKSSREEEEGMY
ncbi:hypothetical protein PVAR5_1516 [Paecilomyces variotii No. 5]|uniref:Uncharacterized protein n=1 Tax=Byssochlamys spectabilis (strain No. 5 / NBRC 109023) TaxID=1356009 RepID=V5F9Q2_BYSSN|nr:hypothetical protein PVAR5_1516 [Paecilomyces variotii No. 5]